MRLQGGSLLDTRRRNRINIKKMIYQREPIVRAEVADRLGLTLPTITTSISEMIHEGLLEEVDIPESQNSSIIGRRPTAVRFCDDAAETAGVELGPYATRAVLMNMNGDILASEKQPAASEEYGEMLAEVVGIIQKIISGRNPGKLIGIGIGLPGFVDTETGMIRACRHKSWVGKNIQKDVSDRIGYPVVLENNVRMRAIGYEMGIKNDNIKAFAYFYASFGLACPLMYRDDIFLSSGAGEIGHTFICLSQDGKQSDKILDDLASDRAIIEKCTAQMEKGGAVKLKEIVKESGELTMKQVLEAQREGDSDVCEAIDAALEYMAVAMASVVNLINPGCIVVDSYITTNEENVGKLSEKARQKFYGINREEANIIFKKFDHFTGAAGAAKTVILRLLLEK